MSNWQVFDSRSDKDSILNLIRKKKILPDPSNFSSTTLSYSSYLQNKILTLYCPIWNHTPHSTSFQQLHLSAVSIKIIHNIVNSHTQFQHLSNGLEQISKLWHQTTFELNNFVTNSRVKTREHLSLQRVVPFRDTKNVCVHIILVNH